MGLSCSVPEKPTYLKEIPPHNNTSSWFDDWELGSDIDLIKKKEAEEEAKMTDYALDDIVNELKKSYKEKANKCIKIYYDHAPYDEHKRLALEKLQQMDKRISITQHDARNRSYSAMFEVCLNKN